MQLLTTYQKFAIIQLHTFAKTNPLQNNKILKLNYSSKWLILDPKLEVLSQYLSGVSRNDRLSHTESECSVPDLLSRDQIDELYRGNFIRTEQPSEQMTIDQRFSNMNKQISELTGLVLALTEKLSSNPGEGNNQNTASDKTCARSDSMIHFVHQQ